MTGYFYTFTNCIIKSSSIPDLSRNTEEKREEAIAALQPWQACSAISISCRLSLLSFPGPLGPGL